MTDDDPLDLVQVAADHEAIDGVRLRSTRPDDSALALLRDLLLDVDADLPAEAGPLILGRGSTVLHLSGEQPPDPRMVRSGAVVALVTAGVLAFGGVAAASTTVAPDGPLAGIGNAVRSAAGAVVSAVKPEPPGRPDAPGRPDSPGRSADAPGLSGDVRAPDDTRSPTHAGRPDDAGRPDGVGRPAEPGRPADPGKPADAGKPVDAGKPDAGKPADAGKSDAGKPEDAGKPAAPEDDAAVSSSTAKVSKQTRTRTPSVGSGVRAGKAR